MPATSAIKGSTRSVYPKVDADGVIRSYRVIVDGKVTDIPASKYRPAPEMNSVHSRIAAGGGREGKTGERKPYVPSQSDLSRMGELRRKARGDLKQALQECYLTQLKVDPNYTAPTPMAVYLGTNLTELEKSQGIGAEDELTSQLGRQAIAAYSNLQKSMLGSANVPGVGTVEGMARASRLLGNLAKNDYALAMAPSVVSTIRAQSEKEAELFKGKSPREKDALMKAGYGLGAHEGAAPLSESERKKIGNYMSSTLDLDPTVMGSATQDPMLTQAARVAWASESRQEVGGVASQLYRRAALSYPPTGVGVEILAEKLKSERSDMRLIPVQIVGEPEYSTLPVDSTKGFVRRISEEGGKQMVALKEEGGVVQVSQDAGHRFDRSIGRPFDQDVPKDKFIMLQLIAGGGEADPKRLDAAWAKMSEGQKETIGSLPMGVRNTGVSVVLKSDAFSHFREQIGREYDPQSALDVINLGHISAGRTPIPVEAWAENPQTPVFEKIGVEKEEISDFVPATASINGGVTGQEISEVSMQDNELATETLLADEYPSEEEEEEKRQNGSRGEGVGQVVGKIAEEMDTSADIFGR